MEFLRRCLLCVLRRVLWIAGSGVVVRETVLDLRWLASGCSMGSLHLARTLEIRGRLERSGVGSRNRVGNRLRQVRV